jgi:Domain of unknown function (DUF4424)
MRTLLVLTLAAALASSTALADDGAASVAAGGIVMKRESRITMAKEVLSISENKVVVDYDFRNDTDTDITTEVAFPIPDFKPEELSPSFQGFDDFKLWVDEKPVHYTIETTALVGGRDGSSLLRSMGIDIQSFGHSNDDNTRPQIDALNSTQKERLRKAGLIDDQYGRPNWTVRKKYYWSQTFPAHGTIHIRHEYTPVLGNSNTVIFDKKAPDSVDTVCVDGSLRKKVQGYVMNSNNETPFYYVDFILTTANTWKTPIEDFTLIVERPHSKGAREDFVSFCWNGPVVKLDADHFSAHINNLVPSRELRVGFIPVLENYWNGTPH